MVPFEDGDIRNDFGGLKNQDGIGYKKPEIEEPTSFEIKPATGNFLFSNLSGILHKLISSHVAFRC